MATTTQSLTVRMDPSLYRRVSQVANRHGRSINAFVLESLQRSLKEEADRELYEAGTILGSDPDECDVEYAIHAQAEVMLNDRD